MTDESQTTSQPLQPTLTVLLQTRDPDQRNWHLTANQPHDALHTYTQGRKPT